MKKKIIIGTLVASMMIATGCGVGATVNTTEGEVPVTQAQANAATSKAVNIGNKSNVLFQSLDNLYSTLDIKGIIKQFGEPKNFTVYDVTNSTNLYFCQLEYEGFEIGMLLDQNGYAEITGVDIHKDMIDYVGGFKLGTISGDLVGALRSQYGVLPKAENDSVGCLNDKKVDVTYNLGNYDINYTFLGEPGSANKPVLNTEKLSEINIYKEGVCDKYDISFVPEDMGLYCFTNY